MLHYAWRLDYSLAISGWIRFSSVRLHCETWAPVMPLLSCSFPQIYWLSSSSFLIQMKCQPDVPVCIIQLAPRTESTRCRITFCTWPQKCMRQVLRLKRYLEYSGFPTYLRLRSEKYEAMQFQFNLHSSLNQKNFSFYSMVTQSVLQLFETHKPGEWKKSPLNAVCFVVFSSTH